jgi:hypothetical protein
MKLRLSEDFKISFTKLDCYFSFLQCAKPANRNLFKDFCNAAEMEKNCSNGISYFEILTRSLFDENIIFAGTFIILFTFYVRTLFFP